MVALDNVISSPGKLLSQFNRLSYYGSQPKGPAAFSSFSTQVNETNRFERPTTRLRAPPSSQRNQILLHTLCTWISNWRQARRQTGEILGPEWSNTRKIWAYWRYWSFVDKNVHWPCAEMTCAQFAELVLAKERYTKGNIYGGDYTRQRIIYRFTRLRTLPVTGPRLYGKNWSSVTSYQALLGWSKLLPAGTPRGIKSWFLS